MLLSITALMPTRRSPEAGIFIERRLQAIARQTELQAIHLHPWFPVLRRLDCSVNDSSVPTDHLPVLYTPGVFTHLHHLWYERTLEPAVKNILNHQSVDAIDAQFGYPTGVSACNVAKKFNIPNFVTIRGVEQSQLKDKKVSSRLQSCFGSCNGIIAVSHSLRQAAIENGVSPNKIAVIPNSVDTKTFFPGSRISTKQELGFSQETPLIVSAGYLIPRKGYHDLLNAFALVQKNNPTAKLVIIGGNPPYQRGYENKLRAQIAELSLAQNVDFIGQQPPTVVAKWLRAADIFALATYREGCCNVVLESLASGTPVVTTPAGDNAEYVKAEHNGLLSPIGDAKSMGLNLLRALQIEWDHLAIASPAASYTWDDVASQVLQFIQTRS